MTESEEMKKRRDALKAAQKALTAALRDYGAGVSIFKLREEVEYRCIKVYQQWEKEHAE